MKRTVPCLFLILSAALLVPAAAHAQYFFHIHDCDAVLPSIEATHVNEYCSNTDFAVTVPIHCSQRDTVGPNTLKNENLQCDAFQLSGSAGCIWTYYGHCGANFASATITMAVDSHNRYPFCSEDTSGGVVYQFGCTSYDQHQSQECYCDPGAQNWRCSSGVKLNTP